MSILAQIAAWITRRFYPRGTQRMLRLLFNPRRLRVEEIMPYDGDLKIKVNTSSYVEWELFFRGYYEKWVIDLMKKLIPTGGVAVDAGANIGTHTLIMAKLVGPGGRVFAFDPDPKSAKRLADNILLNSFSQTEILPIALSDKAGRMKFYVYSSEMLDQGTASLYELPKLKAAEMEVEAKTLDQVLAEKKIERLDLVKIDTRGSDFPVIQGAAGSIAKLRPFVIFEYNRENWQRSGHKWQEAKSFFDGQNYSLYLIEVRGGLKKIEQADGKTSYNILAAPKERLKI